MAHTLGLCGVTDLGDDSLFEVKAEIPGKGRQGGLDMPITGREQPIQLGLSPQADPGPRESPACSVTHPLGYVWQVGGNQYVSKGP